MAGGEEDFGSLFEGMVVLGDDLSSSSSDHLDDRLSQPLDENLFSDLTITSPDQPLPSPYPSAAGAPPSRPGARRKKRGTVRVGYARSSAGGGVRHADDAREDGVSASLSRSSTFDGESAAADEVLEDDDRHDQDPKDHHRIPDSDPDHARGISQLPPPIEEQMDEKSNLGRIEKSNVEDETDEKSNLAPDANHQVDDGRIEKSNLVDIGRFEMSIVVLESHEEGGGKESPPFSIEERLVLIRESICSKREEILRMAASLSAARKEASRRRRKAVEDVNSTAEKYKELERELEEACEAEDFERAEKVSERLLEVGQEKLGFLGAHKDAEKECDSIDLEMQRVLEMQIEAEAESAAMLEAFAKVSGSW